MSQDPLSATTLTSILDVLASSFQLQLSIFTSIVLLLLHKYLRRDPKVKKRLDKFPGPSSLPIVGNSLELNVPGRELLSTVTSLLERYGPRVRLWMFNLPYIVFSSAEDVQAIMSSPIHINKSRDYNVMRPWLGNSLGLAGGHHCASRRKLVTGAFLSGLKDEYLEVMNEQAQIFRKVLDDECVGKGIVDLYPYCFRCALDIISEAAMGTKLYAQTIKEGSKYLQAIIEIQELIVKRMLKPWLQPNFMWKLFGYSKIEKDYLKTAHTFTEKVIQDRKKALEHKAPTVSNNTSQNKKPRLAFLDLLLEASKSEGGLSDLEIRNETDLFMVAGHDTSGSALSWTLFLLAHHPNSMRRVQKELDEIFADDPERKVTSEDLNKMQYLGMCFKESLRLRPSIPFIFRALDEDLTLSDGKVVPAGTSVSISIVDLHKDPNVFPDPEKFDPERFSPENCSGRNLYAYVPFAAGPRNCIGQVFGRNEAKVVLSTILRHFSFEPGQSMDSIDVAPDVKLRPLKGLLFSVKRRSPST